MLTCPKCKELNGNDRATCYKCGTRLGTASGSHNAGNKKICQSCGTTHPFHLDRCPTCGGPLSVYSNSSAGGSSDAWMFVLAVLIPLLGIILGCISIAKDDRSQGKKLIITSVVVWLFVAFFWAAFSMM